ncbi:MAG TPA: hypothetical protein DCS07_08555 [Bdellovibrionales bacterium]|nr:MAG: hypothetical protein A2Z97_02945 [Bdellovibrionales bacterium GWB1_52_6]OFZ03453.1 MAG: hypothetical protein A2X97_05760 [Bdellovibrionales bacterium GWA1_52_35]OFZ41592.1 MAG: hypothetical protein A2070_04140 [Bdellovibrionales bacterium GWC1_52_8]HAR42661.1 hypothetical protein [Bdellovibrionales bacterium]HCM41034.1 hypothetical protein [Bdellovibrionales bacterium]
MQKNSNQNTRNEETTTEVLYQRLGSRWYAFSLIDDEVFVGSISEDEVEGLWLDAIPNNSLQAPHLNR